MTPGEKFTQRLRRIAEHFCKDPNPLDLKTALEAAEEEVGMMPDELSEDLIQELTLMDLDSSQGLVKVAEQLLYPSEILKAVYEDNYIFWEETFVRRYSGPWVKRELDLQNLVEIPIYVGKQPNGLFPIEPLMEWIDEAEAEIQSRTKATGCETV